MAGAWPVVLIHSNDEPIGHALRFGLQMQKVCAQICPDAAALLDSPALLQAHCLVLLYHPSELITAWRIRLLNGKALAALCGGSSLDV